MLKRFLLTITVFVLFQALAAVAMAAPAEQGPGKLSVTGHAEVAVTPDVAILTTGIVTTGDSVEAARGENERIMRQIIDAVRAQGVDKAKITTSQFNLEPVYRNDARDGGRGSIVGYRLQNNVTVVIEDLPKTGAVIDAAFNAGANQFFGLRFALKDDTKVKEELLKQAIQDGRRKAGIMAEALGVTLGLPASVSETGRAIPLAADNFRLAKAPASVPVEAGSLLVGVDVNIVYNIR